jgi:hypothetical protein
MHLTPLYTLTGSTVLEQLGKVQEGERIKIEFRGRSAPDSPIQGAGRGSNWLLVSPLGSAEMNGVQELVTAGGERLVLELRGYAESRDGGGMEIRAAGMIRTSAASLVRLNGRVAVVVQHLGADDTITVQAYEL